VNKQNKIVLFISLSLSLSLSACKTENIEKETKTVVIRPVKTITATPVNDLISRTYAAVVTTSQQVELSFRVSGKLQELPIKNGDRVKQGDVIAKLDERDFKANITQVESQLNQENAQLKALRAGARPEDIAALNAAVKAAESEVQKAQSQFNRTEGLVKKQVIARQELDNDRSALTVAKANLDARKQELIKGKAGGRKEDVSAQLANIEGLKSQLKNLQETLKDATLRAPFNGIISTHSVENFSNIQAKETIATIHKASEEVFNIPAPDVVVLSPERENIILAVSLDSFPNLPLSAVTSTPSGEPFIWIINESNQVVKRPVSLGNAAGDQVVITEGITEGDVIATAGISVLQENMTVKPITAVGE